MGDIHMGVYLDRAKELRKIADPHYNCAQAVLVPFAEQSEMGPEQAYSVAQAFGRGMQMGSVCGACVGALMALGVEGLADPKTTSGVVRRMKENHGGVITCAELLRRCAEAGEDRHVHCDNMVFEGVSIVEELMEARGR